VSISFLSYCFFALEKMKEKKVKKTRTATACFLNFFYKKFFNEKQKVCYNIKIMNKKLFLRIFFNIGIFLSIIFTPWYVQIFLIILGIFFFDFF